MKVSGVNNLSFKSGQILPVNSNLPEKRDEIRYLSNVTPDFGVITPASFRKISVNKLDNGLKIHSYKLSNGYRVTIVPMEDSPAVAKTYVNVGSLNETSNIKGISHFLEHMAFNGTNGNNGHIELKTGDSFKKLDEIGGWANASTNYAMTDYVNSTPLLSDNDLETQIKVLSAMTEDLKLSEEMIKKEKGPVSSEINMILDDPKTIAMDQTVRTLFNIKNPADELVGGSVKHIQNLTREHVMDYYNKYYTPDNINVVITGNVNPDKAIELVAKNFTSRKQTQGNKFEEKISPLKKTVRKDFISDKATSAEIILGFAGPQNNNTRDKIIFNIARSYILSQNSELYKNLKEFNSYPNISSEKISTNPNNPRMIYLAVSASENNGEDVLKTIFKTISNLKDIDKKETERIKEKILKSREDYLENSQNVNFEIGTSILDGDIETITEFKDILESVTPEEINQAVKKYFNLNKTAITVVHPLSQQNVSFKGKRSPIKMENVTEYTGQNNYNIGFYDTKSNNIECDFTLRTNIPYHKKAGVVSVLDEIYSMGMKGISEDDFNKIKEDNNILLYATASPSGISVVTDSSKKNYKKNLMLAKKLLYNPNITEENIEKAKQIIRDRIERSQTDSISLYSQYESKNNPYEYSKDDVLNSLDSITAEDVRDCYKYLTENSRGIVTANVPTENSDVKDYVTQIVDSMKPVKENIYIPAKYFTKNNEPKVITEANNNSQADILQTFTFKSEGTIKETVTGEIMNSILNSSSIGLFDTLREKQNLAYSVHSEISKTGNRGEILLNILTTTDNKEIGETKYDNIQKSIDGFNNQIQELINGNFTEKDFNSAKLAIKAKLLENEGRSAKLGSIADGMLSQYGIEYINKLYSEIDNISKEDIINFAQKAFANKPVYSIVASQDTLDANKTYFEQIKQN